MSNAVVTMAFSDEYRAIGRDLTFAPLQAYARQCGAEWYDIHTPKSVRPWPGTPFTWCWELMSQVYDLLGVYDRVLMAHVDVIVRKDLLLLPSPFTFNVFNMLPKGFFYGFDEYPFDDAPLNEGKCKTVWEYVRTEWPDEFGAMTDDPTFLYNSGLFLVDRAHRELFAPVSREIDYGMVEMAVINMRLQKYGFPHRNVHPHIMNASHLLRAGDPLPWFLHVMWQQPQTKYEAVRSWMARMGYDE